HNRHLHQFMLPASDLYTIAHQKLIYPLSFLFFFFLTRRPPTSTLFPYTTLFRSARLRGLPQHEVHRVALVGRDVDARAARSTRRSEEHTSELQSLAYLVCRLLLEKKKNEVDRDETVHHPVMCSFHCRLIRPSAYQ